MIPNTRNMIVAAAGSLAALAMTAPAQAVTEFDQDVTNNVIMGTGIGNGSFTTDRHGDWELGLRGKLRHNASGVPSGTYNSNGDGTYTFQAGVAPTQSFPTAEWSIEWSINENYTGLGSTGNLKAQPYILGIDSDPSPATNFTTVDLLQSINPNNGQVFWDHSIGDNTTPQSGGAEAVDATDYDNLLSNNSLVQNSWKAHWLIPGFDPTVEGVYDFYLESNTIGGLVRTEIQIIVVPEPASLALMGLGGLMMLRRRRA